jgi:hypothetical protein
MAKWLDRRDFGDYGDYMRAQYAELIPWTAKGDADAIEWINHADVLFAYRESNRRPAPKNNRKPPCPTLDDFDKPGVIWGNA